MACLFCRSETDLTVEHVFPAFSGAHLTVPDASCRGCNGECSKFEDTIATKTRTLRNLFEIANRYGDVPAARVTVRIEDLNIPARRRGDGEIALHDFVAKVPTDDGKQRRHGFFVSEESANRFIERARVRGEKVTVDDVLLPTELSIEPVSAQTLEFAFSREARQVAAKIALLALAYEQGVDFALQVQFDLLRDSILKKPDILPVRIFANSEFVASHLRNPRQHSVITYLSAGMHKGWSLITLFGGLSYAVQLTEAFNERESRLTSLHYDTRGKEIIHPIVLYNEYELIGRVLSPLSKFESQEAVDEQWYPIIEAECRACGVEVSRLKPTLAQNG